MLSHGSAGTVRPIRDFVLQPDSTAYALGSYVSGTETRPTFWKSTDKGVTWTQTIDPFAGLQYPAAGAFGGGTKQKGLRTGIAGNGVIVLVMEGNPDYSDSFKNLRVSFDDGVTQRL
jgi:hypothetical protein